MELLPRPILLTCDYRIFEKANRCHRTSEKKLTEESLHFDISLSKPGKDSRYWSPLRNFVCFEKKMPGADQGLPFNSISLKKKKKNEIFMTVLTTVVEGVVGGAFLTPFTAAKSTTVFQNL